LTALGPEPEPEALAQAPFLEAVCHETLRLYPAASAAGRKLVKPLQVAGCDLPAGAGVVISILWAHSNPEVFPEPERFLPERFLDRSYSPFEFLPFGGGHRRCIGAAMGLYEMKLVLGTLLSRLAFTRASTKPIRVVQFVGLEPSAPVKLFARQR
jgi:cytochrome P450